MWLLDTAVFCLKEFAEGSIPKYAILSHTWLEEEVTFRDIADLNVAIKRKGWQKVAGCCHRAVNDGHDWVWIDTCCIDKSSSAELSEAINSMWRYYEQAQICYVYLADVPQPTTLVVTKSNLLIDDRMQGKHAETEWLEKFKDSRWFTRGWTLQELLAPSELLFLTKDWCALGTKQGLSQTIESVTGITRPFLLGDSPRTASIACRMSWAATRQTTRTEDIAYCLLGIFDINMPLLYGEGKKAFRRLQMELVNSSTDETIFAWTCESSNTPAESLHGVLADSPLYFAGCGNMTSTTATTGISTRTVTNAGIRVRSILAPLPPLRMPSRYKYINANLWYLQLACYQFENGRHDRVGIALNMVGEMVEREAPKPGEKSLGPHIRTAVRAFPDLLHSDYRDGVGTVRYKTVYLQLE